MNNVQFKQARLSELSVALQLLKEAAEWLQTKNTKQWNFWINPPAEKIAWIKEGFENREFYFVYQGGELAGMFRLMYYDEKYWGSRPDKFDKAAYVHSLTVRLDFKGNGFGSLILKMIEKKLTEENIYKFRLDCMKNNIGLCSYYEKYGFQKVGEVKMSWAVQNLYEKKLA